jgi:5-methylcytosine-specific restriction endonuclease McrA
MAADPKQPRRIVDPELMREMTAAGKSGHCPCLVCAERYTEPHHVRLKSQGGDDLEDNIAFLCARCHRAYHGNPYTDEFGMYVDAGWVRFRLARWLESDNGAYCRGYLVRKLGRMPADAFLHREFGIRSAA